MIFKGIINLNFGSVVRMCDMQWHSKSSCRRTAFYRAVARDKAGYHSST